MDKDVKYSVGVVQAFQPHFITEKFTWSLGRVWWRILVTNLATNFQDLVDNAESLCISQFQLRPSPPGQLRGICVPCQSRGCGISKFGTPGGRAFAYPRAFDTHVVSDSKSKHGGFYRKGPAIRRRLDRPSWTGQTSGGFLDFMHFFIAHQGTTIT